MAKEKDVVILEKVAAVLETGMKADIQKVGKEFVEYVAKAGQSSSTYVWGMGEPLFVIAQQLTDRELRLRAYRLVTHCDDAKISAQLKAAHDGAIALFLLDASLIEDPIERFNIYLNKEKEVWGSFDFRKATGAEALKLVKHFEPGAERIKAYKRVDQFGMDRECRQAVIGIAQEVDHLKTPAARMDVLYAVSAREAPETAKKALATAYLKHAALLADVKRRSFYYLYAFRHFDWPTKQRVAAMDAAAADLDGIKDAVVVVELAKKILDEVPNEHNKGYEAYHPHRRKAVKVLMEHAAKLEDFDQRIHAYCEVARYCDEGDGNEKKAVDAVMADIAGLPTPEQRRDEYEQTARHRSGWSEMMERRASEAWRKEMEQIEPARLLEIIKTSMHSFFGGGDKNFRKAYVGLFEKAVAALPDIEDRVYACINVASRCQRYAGHGLEDPAMEAFKKYLHQIPSKKRREKICWDLMDHDREQTMLPDPPLEAMLFDEWSALHRADENDGEAKRRNAIRKITAKKAALG